MVNDWLKIGRTQLQPSDPAGIDPNTDSDSCRYSNRLTAESAGRATSLTTNAALAAAIGEAVAAPRLGVSAPRRQLCEEIAFPSIEQLRRALGRTECRRISLDCLHHPGRRDEASDDALTIVGVQQGRRALLRSIGTKQSRVR